MQLAVVNSSLALSSNPNDRIRVTVESYLEGRELVARIMRTSGPWWPPDDVPELRVTIVGEPPNHKFFAKAGTSNNLCY